jgi:hypothetical protein
VWQRRWAGPAVAVAVAAGWGLVAGWWTPRGPLTTASALASMLISLGVGAVAGLAMRSRWAMLLSPAVAVVVFELTRLGTDGPSVDAISASPYGLIAFATGRGFHGVLALVPMLLGVALGAAVARRLNDAEPRRTGWRRTGRTRAVASSQ